MPTTTGTTGTPVPFAASQLDLSSMDIETALMAVQTQRANLMETQLKDQMAAIQGRNQIIELLNAALSEIRRQRPNDADTEVYVNKEGGVFSVPVDQLGNGMDTCWQTDPDYDPDAEYASLNATGVLQNYGIEVDSSWMKQDAVDQLIQRVTSKIDSLNSSQQMDMLRLQSLTNKRNEAYDVMTNFLKKSQDSRSSIVGNLR